MSAGVVAFFIALFASMMLTVPVRALALRVGMVDLPGPRKVHVQPIPLLGGLAIYGGVMLAIIFAFDGAAREQSVGIVTGATLVAAVGIYSIQNSYAAAVTNFDAGLAKKIIPLTYK